MAILTRLTRRGEAESGFVPLGAMFLAFVLGGWVACMDLSTMVLIVDYP
jgi:hypothetical protein